LIESSHVTSLAEFLFIQNVFNEAAQASHIGLFLILNKQVKFY